MAGTNLKTDTVLATPPVAVVTATLAGIALQDWVYILTCIYTVCLLGDWIWKKLKAWQERKIFRASMRLPPESEE